MTDSQWRFELESLYALEEKEIEKFMSIADLVKNGIINLLGLNLMPVHEDLSEEEKEILSKFGESTAESYRLRRPKAGEFVPLAILTGSPEMVAEIIKKNQELFEQERIDQSVAQKNLENFDKIPDEDLIEKPDDIDIPEFIDPKDIGKYMKFMNSGSKNSSKGMLESLEDLEKDEDIFVKSNRLERTANKAKILIEY